MVLCFLPIDLLKNNTIHTVFHCLATFHVCLVTAMQSDDNSPTKVQKFERKLLTRGTLDRIQF